MTNSTRFQAAVAAAVAAQLQAMGVTGAQAKVSTAVPAGTAVAVSTGKRGRKSRKAKPETPQWLVDKAKNKAARRKLAEAMRERGEEPTGAAWVAAKAAAGIV